MVLPELAIREADEITNIVDTSIVLDPRPSSDLPLKQEFKTPFALAAEGDLEMQRRIGAVLARLLPPPKQVRR